MLHLTKVAYQAQSLAEVVGWFADRPPVIRHVTRHRPKRADELIGGSLFWILKHQLVGRTEILGFEDAEGGTAILLSSRLIRVNPLPRRAHQGWRYLEGKDAPADFVEGEGELLPIELAGKLANLGLI